MRACVPRNMCEQTANRRIYVYVRKQTLVRRIVHGPDVARVVYVE